MELLGELLRSLEPHLLRIVEAHFPDCIDEALLARSIEEVFEMEAAQGESTWIRLLLYLGFLNVANDLIASPVTVLLWVEIKPSHSVTLVLFWRPPGIRSFLELVPGTKEDFLWKLVESR